MNRATYRRLWLGLALSVSLVGPSLVQAQTPAFKVTEAHALAIPNDASPRIFPSPDGKHIAYERAVRLDGHRDYYLCVLDTIAKAEPFCGLTPMTLPSGFEPNPNSPLVPFSWAPDNKQLAVVGQPLGTQQDTDLWLMEVPSTKWRNLTEDSYAGALAEAPTGTSIEQLPTWSPDGKQIAVERAVTADQGVFEQSTLTLIDVVSGQLTALPLPSQPSALGTVSGLTWSPDGKYIAVTIRHPELNLNVDGVWLVDISNGESRHILKAADVQAAFAKLYPDVKLADISAAMWSPDNTRLLIWLGDAAKKPAVVRPFWYTLADQSFTAVPVALDPAGQADKRMRPIQAAWSPDSAYLLVLTFGFPRDETINALDPQGQAPRLSLRLIEVASGQQHVLGHLPLGPSNALYFANWGTEGDVVMNGYHLKLQ